MKKVVFLVMLISSLFSKDIIKDGYFVGGSYGDLTITDRDNTESYVEAKIGSYFYSDNKYHISNRFYLEVAKMLTENTSFYTTNIKLDWVWNDLPYIKPFIGFSGGYIYYSYQTSNYSSGSYGLQSGILIYLGNNFEIEIGGSTSKATQNTDVWKNTLKKIYAGINISF